LKVYKNVYHSSTSDHHHNMKYILTFALFFCWETFAWSQEVSTLLSRAKEEFRKDYAEQDFNQAVNLLTQARALQAQNAEVNYFLAYAHDRLNARSMAMLNTISRSQTERVSYYLEQVIKINPIYQGEKVALDPHSKIGSVWGALALAYLAQEEPDSAKLAFLEGRKRGGFAEPLLEMARNVLGNCNPKAVLFSAGDNFSFPLWYVQVVEKYRPDVEVLDMGLLNTDWYCLYLDEKAKNPVIRDSLDIGYIPSLMTWTTGKVFAGIAKNRCGEKDEFEWEIPQFHHGEFLYRAEWILLQFILENEFQADVYFTAGFPTEDMLYLDSKLEYGVLVQYLNPCSEVESKAPEEYLQNYQLQSLASNQEAIKNNPDLMTQLNYYRLGYANAIFQLLEAGKKPQARELMKTLESKLPESLLPYFSSSLSEYLGQLKTNLEQE
jgi:hypothetical protein